MQGPECAGDHGGVAPCSVQVPGKAEDYRFEEVGLYERCQGRLPQAEGGEEGVAVRVISFFVLGGWYADTLINCRDGAYLQFIRPKGPLEQNLRNQLRA